MQTWPVRRKYLLAGEFAAAARLSPKALRLYAEQGLLLPASVDPATGYRFYAPDQLPRARLIGRLRRMGLPLRMSGRYSRRPSTVSTYPRSRASCRVWSMYAFTPGYRAK